MCAVGKAIPVFVMPIVLDSGRGTAIESYFIFREAMRPRVVGAECVVLREPVLHRQQKRVVVRVPAVSKASYCGIVLGLRRICQIQSPPEVHV